MRLGITAKILLLCTVVITVVLSVGFYVISSRESRALGEAMKDNSVHITRLIQLQLNELTIEIDKSRRKLQAMLAHIVDTQGIQYVEIYDLTGTVVAHSDESRIGLEPTDPLNLVYALKTLATAEPLTMSHRRENRYERFVPILSPDQDCSVRVIGVVNLAMEFPGTITEAQIALNAKRLGESIENRVAEHFSEVEQRRTELTQIAEELSGIQGVDHIEIIGRDGTLIYHSDHSRIGTRADEEDRAMLARTLDVGDIVQDRSSLDNTFTLFAPIGIADGDGFQGITAAAEVVMDLSQSRHRAIQLHKEMALTMGLLAITVILVLAYFLERFVSGPIMTLSRKTQALAAGDLSVTLDIRQRDEIGLLAESFNLLVHELRSSLSALGTSKSFSDNVLRSMHDALLVVSPEGFIQSANASALDLLGYTRKELLGLPAHQIISDENTGPAGQLTTDMGIVENTYIRKDGSRVPVHFSASIIRSRSGDETLGAVFVAKDITELKQALGALSHSEERFRQLYEGVPLAYQSFDREGILVNVNQAWLDLFGYVHAEVIGRQASSFVAADFRTVFEEHFGSHARTGSVRDLEIAMERKDKTVILVSATASASRDGDGNIVQTHLILADITERKNLEETIARGKRDWEDTFDTITDLITIHDTDFNIVRSNRAAKEVLGLSWDGNSLDKCFDAFLGVGCNTADCPGSNTLRTGKAETREILVPHKNRVYEVQTIPRRDQYRKMIGIIHVARDITERKRHEEILRDIAEGVSRATGEAFLHSLIQYMAKTLELDIALIAAVDPEDTSTARTVSVCIDGEIADNFEYRLVGTPCASLQDQQPCCFPSGIRELFSQDHMLTEIGAESYIGAPLFDSMGRILGIIVGMKRTAMERVESMKPLLQIFAVRAATELERKQVEDELSQRQQSLQSIYTMATTIGGSMGSVYEGTVATLSRVLKVGHAVLLTSQTNGFQVTAYGTRGRTESPETLGSNVLAKEDLPWHRATFQDSGYLAGRYPDHPLIAAIAPRTLLSVPIPDRDGNPTGIIMILDDQERTFRPLEIQLVEIFAKYIAFRGEREGMEASLRNAQRMEVIGKLAGGVAHEVRNPLNAIMAITDAFAKDLGENPEYAPFLEHMRAQVGRLSTLMKDLLDLGKPMDPSKLREENLADICGAALAQWKLSALSQTHVVNMSFPIGDAGVFVNADYKRLQQVFLNLLENAAQHSPAGSEIAVAVKPKKEQVSVSVVDVGAGIPPEILPSIFETFFSTRRGGTGLGLSIVKNIVDLHGGEINIFNNDPPPGCTATITLPLVRKT